MSQNHKVLSAVVGCISSFSLVCLVFSKSRSFVIALRELKKTPLLSCVLYSRHYLVSLRLLHALSCSRLKKTRKQQIDFLQL